MHASKDGEIYISINKYQNKMDTVDIKKKT